MSEEHVPDFQTPESRYADELIAWASQVRAPASLRDGVAAIVKRAPSRQTWRRRLTSGGALAGVALVAAVVALGGSGGGAGVAPYLALAALGPTERAPAHDRSHANRLTVGVQGVPFPYWRTRFHWRATGVRHDVVGDSRVTTVFYAYKDGRGVAYSIAAGPAPALAGAGRSTFVGGVSFAERSVGGRVVVTWLRGGHLCVLSGRNVSPASLVGLASGTERDGTPA